MKKIFTILSITLIAVSALSVVAVEVGKPADVCVMSREISLGCPAEDGTDGEAGCLICANEAEIDVAGDHAICCIMNTVYNVTDWIFIILVGVAALMVLFGAFQLLTAAGTPEKVTSGRNYILYAAVGLAVALMAKAVPGVVKLIVGL